MLAPHEDACSLKGDLPTTATCRCMRAVWSRVRYKEENVELRSCDVCASRYPFRERLSGGGRPQIAPLEAGITNAVFRCPIRRDALLPAPPMPWMIRAQPRLQTRATQPLLQSCLAVARSTSSRLHSPPKRRAHTTVPPSPRTAKGRSPNIGERVSKEEGTPVSCKGKARWSQPKPSPAGETRLGPGR